MDGLHADNPFRPRRALVRTPPGRGSTLPTAAVDVVTEPEGQGKLEHCDSVSIVNHEAEVVEDSAGDGPSAMLQCRDSGPKEAPIENRSDKAQDTSTCIPSSSSSSAMEPAPPACEANSFMQQAPDTPPAHHHPELRGTPNPFAPSRALARTPPPSPPSNTSPAAPEVKCTDLVQAMDICTSTLTAEVVNTCSAATGPADNMDDEKGSDSGGTRISPARTATATSTDERSSIQVGVLEPEAGGRTTVEVPSRHTAARRTMVDTATSTDELSVAEAARHQVELAALRVRLSRSTEEGKRLVASWMDAQDQLQHVQKERDDTVAHVGRLRDELVAIKARGETQGTDQVEKVMQARLCELEATCALSELELALDCLNEQDRLRQVELLHAEASYHSLREKYREDHHSICSLAHGISQRVVSLSGCVGTSVERLQHLVNLQRTSMEHRLKAAKAEHARAEAKMKAAMQHAHARAQQDMDEQMKILKGDKALLVTRLADVEKRAQQEMKRVQERSEEVQRLEAELLELRSKAVIRSDHMFPSAVSTSTDFVDEQAVFHCSPEPRFPLDDHDTEVETVLVAMEVDEPAAGNTQKIAAPVPARDNVKGRRGRKERPTTQQDSPSAQPPKAKRGRPAKLQARAEPPPPPRPQQAGPTSPAGVKLLGVPLEHEPPKMVHEPPKAKGDRPSKLQARPERPPPPRPLQKADAISAPAIGVEVLDVPVGQDPAVPSRTEAPKPLGARSRSCFNVTAKTSDARFKIQKMGIFKAFRGGAIPKLRAEVAHKAEGAITHGV